ncbi:MAG: RraA family protein [Chloroflexi bacterium]|nr:RraA family protein [Chloroflexota bacterium]
MLQNSVLNKLQAYDSATVCNVIELFEARPRNRGFMDGRIKAAFPELPPMVGFAATATCRSFTEPPERELPKVPDLISRFPELSGPPVIVLQNLDTNGAAANFGDVFCNSFKAFGARGLVTNGPGRDLAGIKPLDFPVFYQDIVCAHGYMHLLDLHVPVQVGGIDLYPNALLHGDGNGLTTIPIEIAADVADACAEYAAAEAVVIETAQSGSATLQDLNEAYADMASRIAGLNARLRL